MFFLSTTNHLTLGVYPNGDYKWNVVLDSDLADHINYNKTLRPGRLLYVDGERVHDGLMKGAELEKYDNIAEKFYRDNNIDLNKPSVPYV